MFQECFQDFSRKIEGGFNEVLSGFKKKLNGCLSFHGVSRMLQGSFKGVSRKIEGCSKGYSRELQGILKKFKECFKAVSKMF